MKKLIFLIFICCNTLFVFADVNDPAKEKVNPGDTLKIYYLN